jgi:UDP-N-acetylglucosamine 2-epimerase
MNRRLAGVLTTWHFAPTEPARDNLLAEGVDPTSIYVTGNTSIDALRSVATLDYTFNDPTLRSIVEGDRRMILVTAHRRENWGEPMTHIGNALARLAREFDDCEIVVAMHRNPVVRDTLRPLLESVDHIHLVEPPDYVPFVKLMQRANLILTDSGGVQEEAPSFGVPILVLRRTTERPEGVMAGTAKLIGTDSDVIVNEARKLLTDSGAYAEMARAVNPYGDGSAAAKIVGVLKSS